MFEGNFQHDAQELLRCLLCYMEDAERDIQKMKDKILVKADPDMEESTSMDSETEAVKISNRSSIISTKTDVCKVEAVSDCCETNSTEDNIDKGERETEGLSQQNDSEKPRKQFKLKGGAPPTRTAKKKAAQNGSVIKEVENSDCKKKKMSNRQNVAKSELNGIDGVKKRGFDQSVEAEVHRGVKRKRSSSRSTNKQNNGEDCVDGGSLVEAVEETKQKEESTALASVFKNSMVVTKKKIEGNGQNIVSFFKKVKARLVPSTGPAVDLSALSKEDEIDDAKTASSSQSELSVTTKQQPKQLKRMGMTGFVFIQSNPSLETCTNEVKKTEDNDDDDSDCMVIEDGEDCKILSSNSCCELKVAKHEENGINSSSGTSYSFSQAVDQANNSSNKSPDRLAAVCSTSKSVKSLHSLEDEITPAVEHELGLDIESTINSVTRKYYSSLSRPELNQAASSQLSEAHGKSSDLMEDVPGESVEDSMQKQTSPSPVCSLTPGKDVIIHSPTKADMKRPGSSDLRPSKVVKAIQFELAKDLSDSNARSSAFETDVNVMDFLPRSARLVTDSKTAGKLRNHLLNLDDDGISTRSYRSAPSTPVCDSSKTKSRLAAKMGKAEGKAATIFKDLFVSSNDVGERELAPVKIELKRCDWLGVSPVKSVSAASAIRNLRWQEKQPLAGSGKGTSGVKRSLLKDLDLFGIKESISQESDVETRNHTISNHVQQSLDKTHQPSDGCEDQLSNPSCGTEKSKRRSSRTLKQHRVCERNYSFSVKFAQSVKDCTKNDPKTAVQPNCRSPVASRDIRTMLMQPQGSNTPNVSKEISCPPGLKLKSLSVSVDKCDWMLASPTVATPSLRHWQPVSVQQKKMINGKVKVKRFSRKAGSKPNIEVNSSLGSNQQHLDSQPDSKEGEHVGMCVCVCLSA